MASIFNFLFSLILFLGLIFEANAGCSLRNISIGQSGTGNWAHGMSERKVSITNNCECPQSQVKFKCNGFQTNKAIDPSILTINGDQCILKNGKPIAPCETVQFLYAWDPPFPFQPLSSRLLCDS